MLAYRLPIKSAKWACSPVRQNRDAEDPSECQYLQMGRFTSMGVDSIGLSTWRSLITPDSDAAKQPVAKVV